MSRSHGVLLCCGLFTCQLTLGEDSDRSFDDDDDTTCHRPTTLAPPGRCGLTLTKAKPDPDRVQLTANSTGGPTRASTIGRIALRMSRRSAEPRGGS